VAGSPALLARLFRERYESWPPWGVTQRCLPGGCHGAPIGHPKVLPGPLWDGEEEHAVRIDWMQEALWPLVLRSRATASSPAVITTHSNSMVCCQPRRAHRRRACGRVMPWRGCRRGCHPPAPRPDLLAYWHLLTEGQPAEDVQHGGQPGVRTSQAVLNGAQGLPFWFGEAHHHHVRGWGRGSAGPGCMSLVKSVLPG
jgi:hypothetical protein